MNDIARFMALYRKIGVEIKVEDFRNGEVFFTIETGTNDNVNGYSGFYTTFYFDNDGNFIRQEIYE